MRYIQDPESGKLIPASKYRRHHCGAPVVLKDIEGFVSPVDQTFIDDRRKLREHNIKHGVTDLRDYGEHYFERKAQERNARLNAADRASRQERVNTILNAIETHSR